MSTYDCTKCGAMLKREDVLQVYAPISINKETFVHVYESGYDVYALCGPVFISLSGDEQ